MENHFPNLFCAECQAYLAPGKASCSSTCPSRERHFPQVGEALWQARVDGNVTAAHISGSLVIFCYGVRNGAGGVAAFAQADGKPAWNFKTPGSVEGGIAQGGEFLYFATCGFLGSGAALTCLHVDGRPAWQVELPAGAWSKPVLDESRVYIGLESGQVLGFDNRNGTPISVPRPVSLPRAKKLWLALVDSKTLVALSNKGDILALNPMGLGEQWKLSLPLEITSPPCVANGKLVFGAADGQLLLLDPRSRSTRQLAANLEGVRAVPVFAQGKLWVGAYDHRLHILDETGRELWKSEKYAHSIGSAVGVSEGIAAICVNDYGVVLLSAHSHEPIGAFEKINGARLFASPVISDGTIYTGTNNGDIFALPWHLGRYESAARQLEHARDFHQAALFYALAAQQSKSKDEREALNLAAERCWDKNGEPEWAARMWEGMAHEQKAAEAYQRAAEHRRGPNNQRAAEYYYAASRLYWRLNDKSKKEDCESQAAKLGRWPLIRLEEKHNPRMVQGKEDTITIRAENIGYGETSELNFFLGGSLSKPYAYSVIIPLEPENYFDITIPVIPTKLSDHLTIEVEYKSKNHQKAPFTAFLTFKIEADEAPQEITIGDVVLGDITIMTSGNKRLSIKTGDIVRSTIKVVTGNETSTKHPTSPTPAGFTWPETVNGLDGDEITLVEVLEHLGDECVVPNHRWAVFLANEEVIASVPPGRHLRKDYPSISLKFGSFHKPDWKAIIFSGAVFRLPYRLGPFRTSEAVNTWVACGLTVHIDESKSLGMWSSLLPGRATLTNLELAQKLHGEVSGTLQKWIARQSEKQLSAAFDRRDEIMLSLLEELRPSHRQYGISLLEPLYYLNFIIPGREHLDNARETIYWQGQHSQLSNHPARCPHCQAELAPNAKFCDKCSAKIKL